MSDNSYAYAEILEILDNMSEIYVKKIPNRLIEYFKENASKNTKNILYHIKICLNKI